MTTRLKSAYYVMFLVIATFLVYFQVYKFSFVTLDDAVHVYDNSKLESFAFSDLIRLFKAPYQGLYIPFTYLVWWLQICFVKGFISTGSEPLDPTFFHLVNLFLHIINVVLVYGIIHTLIRVRMAALVGALFFAWHPLQVETVAWISALKDLLSSAFGLFAVWLVLQLKPGWTKREKECRIFLFASLSFLIALLSKPSMVMLPFIVLILFWVKDRNNVKDHLTVVIPWVLLSFPIIVLTKLGQPNFMVENKVGLAWGPVVALDALVFYFSKLIFPFSLTLNYGRTPNIVIQNWWSIHLWVVPILLWLLIKKRNSNKFLLAMMGIFIVYLVPVLGLVPFYFQKYSTVSDRFCYLSLLGVGLLIGKIWVSSSPRIGKVLIVLCLVFWGLRSFDQLKHWHNNEALLTHTSTINPNTELFYTLGFLFSKQGRWTEAVQQYKNAIQYDSTYYSALNNLALLYMEKGKLAQAEWWLKKAIELVPYSSEVNHNLGVVYLHKGQKEKAKTFFERSKASKVKLTQKDLTKISKNNSGGKKSGGSKI